MASRIGILTDTHDEHYALQAALKRFADSECSSILLLGDITTARTFELFSQLPSSINLYWISGNHDEKDQLLAVSNRIGAGYLGAGFGTASIEGHRFGLCHSTYERSGNRTLIAEWCLSGDYDYVLYGHVHYFNLKFPSRDCGTTLLNPGGFYYKYPQTMTILDPVSKILDLYLYQDGYQEGFVLTGSINLSDRLSKKVPLGRIILRRLSVYGAGARPKHSGAKTIISMPVLRIGLESTVSLAE